MRESAPRSKKGFRQVALELSRTEEDEVEKADVLIVV
jgi:hypothetical protein